MLKEIIEKVLEDKWSQNVKTKWKPPKGTFAKETKPVDTAKTVCDGHKGDLKSAVASVDFYFNRKKEEPGDEKRRKEIIDILHKICKG